jgi:threonine/homoserine/homoserine lactone efflux protein
LDNAVVFLVSVLILLIVPGPTNTLLATSGATVGFRRSTPLLFAETAGYILSIVLIEFMLGPAISGAYPTASILRLAAGAYLLMLAMKLWTTPFLVARVVISLRQVFVTTLLNPKALVFALVIIPFRSPHASLYLAVFTAIVPAVGTLWIATGSFLGHHTHPDYAKSFPKAAAIVLAVMSAALIASAVFSRSF